MQQNRRTLKVFDVAIVQRPFLDDICVLLSTDYATRGIFHEKVVEMVVYIEQHSPAVVILNQPDVGTTGKGQKRIVQASGPPATRVMSITPLVGSETTRRKAQGTITIYGLGRARTRDITLKLLSTDYATRRIFHEKAVEMVVYIEQHVLKEQ